MTSAESIVPRVNVPLAPMTTLGVGGPARWFVDARSLQDVIGALRWSDDRRCPLFVLGGGSNLVVSDAGFDGLVIRVDIQGSDLRQSGGELRIEAAAGEPWDGVVRCAVDEGFAGIECLSGIPGTVGGAPVQNVGAYGQEVAQTLESVTAVDRTTGRVEEIAAEACGFGYRQSRFKAADRDRFIIAGVRFRLRDERPAPGYQDIMASIERAGIRDPSVADVRRAVLGVRRAKGMVIDPMDPDSRSVGSFFMNPVVDAAVHREMARAGDARGERAPGFPQEDGGVKVPAAWLIERSGFSKGMTHGGAGLSARHPLAIINRGGATACAIVDLAVLVKQRVFDTFGVWLRPEPVFVGFADEGAISFLRDA